MIKNELQRLVSDCLKEVFEEHQLEASAVPPVHLERPRDPAHGDWATNVAMVCASRLDMNPRSLAEELVSRLKVKAKPNFLAKIEIAGPGFVNFRLSNEYLYEALGQVLQEREEYGRSAATRGRVQIEFVSANPVGPMHVGHGRWAAIGDSLARLMQAAGWRVEREFYINDYGNQMTLFGLSVAARYKEVLGRPLELPLDGYQGHYIKEIAEEIAASDGDRYLRLEGEEEANVFSEIAYGRVLEHLRSTLEAMGVRFDSWFSERELHQGGAINKSIEELRSRGWVYERDGAVWLRTSDLGDDKDRVLIREDGRPTYFAADIAYHRSKMARGYDKIINIWGADHHGYVKRMEAAVKALGAPEGWMEVIIGQLVNLFQGGRPVRMSKRTGEMVTLEELVKEVGADAARYFFLMRSTDTSLDFDIDLAKSRTNENPVYYVQYAHARISSILSLAMDRGYMEDAPVDMKLLSSEPELDLMRELAKLPGAIELAAERRAPHRLTQYAEGLATKFHFFYHKCRVVTDDRSLSTARLALVRATRYTLANVLDLLGVSAPESM